MRERPGRLPLIGRAGDLAVLDGWVTESRADVVLGVLGGDAGVGKSRLIIEHTNRAEAAGALVLTGGCLELGSGWVPFAPFVEAFGPLRHADLPKAAVHSQAISLLVPELGADRPPDSASPHLDPEIEQTRLFVSVRRLLESLAATRPVELVLEDLHWADASARDLLTYLVRTTEQPGLVIIGTYRGDDLHRRHPLRPLLAELLRSERTRHHVLEPLSEPVAREMAGELIGPASSRVLDSLVVRSGGNPFALEVLAAAHNAGHVGLPSALGDVLTNRLTDLPGPVMNLLRAMAVVGRPASHELLVELVGAPEADVEEALAHAVEVQQVIVDAEDRYTFRHALLTEAVVATTLPGQRRRLHRRLAEILEEHPELAVRGGQKVESASHWLASGDQARGLTAATAAIEEATGRHAYAQVLEFAEHALELWADVDDPETMTGWTVIALLRTAAEAAYHTGDYSRAEQLVAAALELVDERSEPILAGRLTERVGRFRWASGQPADRTEQAYRRAVELVPSSPASSDRAQVLASLGQFMMLRTRLPEAVDWCQQALRMARESGDELVEGHAACSLGAALTELGDLTGLEYARQALEIADRRGNLDDLGRAYVNLTAALLDASEWTEAIQRGYEGLQRCRDDGLSDSYHVALTENLGRALLARGRFEEARATVRGSRYAGSRHGQLWVILLRSELELLAGDSGAALRELSLARSIGPADDPISFHHNLAVSAAVAAARGDWGEVHAVVRDGLEIVEGETTDLRRVQVGAALARVLDDVPSDDRTASSGRLLGGAIGAAERLRRRMGDRVIPVVPVVEMELRRRLADMRDEAAAPSWEDVAAAWERDGNRINEMRARIVAVQKALEDGDRSRAEAAWVGARALADTMDVPALADRLDGVGRRGRLTIARTEASDPYGLTARELEVLGLLANGRTNPQIGAILFISEKTASVHVSNILRKLAVANRGEAAALALRKGLAG